MVGRRAASAPVGLDRHTLTGPGSFFFGVSASAPMTALVGGVVAGFASGVLGVPAAFALVTVALVLFSVGYASMARHVRHAGPLYAHVARGLGPIRGVAAAVVALLAYNAIQMCMYGLLGATLAGLLGGPWWVWSLSAWVVVAVLGLRHVRFNAVVVTGLLVAEIAVVVAFDLAALSSPAGGHVAGGSLSPASLLGGGPAVGGVLALAVASFMGYESTLAFAEEARSTRSVARATLGSLVFLGVLYTVSAWAVAVWLGPDRMASADGGLVFTVLHDRFGTLVSVVASLMLVTSMLAAQVSVHSTIARYLYSLTRERLLPARLGRIRSGSGVPVGGSVAQSVLALGTVVGWAAVGGDPMVLFAGLTALAAVGLMSLMAVSSLAVVRFYRKGGGGNESWWVRVGAPMGGAVAMTGLVVVTVANLESLTGPGSGPVMRWLLPGLIAGGALVGLIWGWAVRARRREVTAGLGRGEREPLAELEHHLIGVDI